MTNTKIPVKIALGNILDCKKVCRLHPGEYFWLHPYDEPWNTIDIYQKVREIVLGPQYNLQGGYLFEILMTVKFLWRSH